MERLGRSSLFEGAIALFVHQPWYGFQFLCPACSSLQGKPTWPRSEARALQSERADGLKQAVVTPGNHITGVVSVNTALTAVSRNASPKSPSRRGAAQPHHRARGRGRVQHYDAHGAPWRQHSRGDKGPRPAVCVSRYRHYQQDHIADSVAESIRPYKVSDLTQDNGASYDPREPRLSKLREASRAAPLGTNSSISSGVSYPSACATGPMGSDRREVLTVTIGSLVFDAN
ncbi:MAG: hypothetical protein USCAAHI_00986 [Beijerinckiaceae bacterium]|nr:MAG: hypothetical protein USCAAHI_00986 [Beijerinckiaceae bacterium]